MNVITYSLFTLTLLFFVACGGAGSKVPAVPGSPAAGVQADKKPLVGINPELNASTSSAPDVNGSHYVEHAYLYLEQNKLKYGLEAPRSQLAFKSENIDNIQNKHVIFQQVHKSVPVWGREIIVHLDANNSVYRISGKILTEISMLNIQPVIAKEKAGDIAMQTNQWRGKGWQVKDTELYIFNQNSNNYLVYRLTLLKGLLREFVFMNAHDGEIIHRISGTHTIN